MTYCCGHGLQIRAISNTLDISERSGLEKRFANEVKNTLNYLIKNPLLFQVKYKSVRTAYTEVFPYGVHYHFNENTQTITVLGVFHTSVSPDKWEKRL